MSEKGQQHDPGPWELEEDGGIRAACGGCIGFVQPHGNVNTIARCGESFSSANGHLMAAAPELLKELENWHAYSVSGGWHECDPGICPAVDAIAKARGAA